MFYSNSLTQFDSKGNISADMHGFKKTPSLKDKIHCCVFVLDALKIETMDDELKKKLSEMRKKITSRGWDMNLAEAFT